MRLPSSNRIFLCVFELMRGGFDVFADLTGALDDAGNEVDPVLREVVAVAPFGVAINAVRMLQHDGCITLPLAAFYIPARAWRLIRSFGRVFRDCRTGASSMTRTIWFQKSTCRTARSTCSNTTPTATLRRLLCRPAACCNIVTPPLRNPRR